MNLSAYVGIPFAHKGDSRAGLSCWGLVRLVLREQAGIEVPGYEELYEDVLDARIPAIFERESALMWNKVFVPRPLDVALMRIKGHPWHVGVIGHAGMMLHCEQDIGSIYEPYRGLKWEKRILGFYRHRHLDKDLAS